MIIQNQGIHIEKIKNFCSRESGYKKNKTKRRRRRRRRRKEQDRTGQDRTEQSEFFLIVIFHRLLIKPHV
jgi:hypothetical protein